MTVLTSCLCHKFLVILSLLSHHRISLPLCPQRVCHIKSIPKMYPVEGMTVTPDIPVCTQFYTNTCACDKAQGNLCSTLFTLDYIIDMRAKCSLLSHDELDLVLMGFITSALLDSDSIRDGHHQNTAK